MRNACAHVGLRDRATTSLARALAARPRLGRYPGYHRLADESAVLEPVEPEAHDADTVNLVAWPAERMAQVEAAAA